MVNAENIKVHGAHWKGYIEPDISGVYIELVKHIYPADNLEFDISTFARAKRLFLNKQSDILIGVYKNDLLPNENVTLPKHHLDLEYPTIAIFNPTKNDIKNKSDLSGLVVAWYEEYGYKDLVPESVVEYQFGDIEQAFKLLKSGRIDVIVDHAYNVNEQEGKRFSTFELTPERPIWLAFQNSEKGRMLKQTFDKNMVKLRESGQLKKIFGDEYDRAQFHTVFAK